MSLIKNSRIKIATIYILLAYLCIFMVQANDTSNSNNHKNNINNEHHHSHHNHHHHHHHSQQPHNQYLRSRSHYSNSIRNNNKNNKNSNLNTTNTNINLDRRKILNITPTTTTNISPSAAIDNKFISNRSLKQNYSKISNNDNNHKLNLHKRNSIDNNNRTVNGNSANENLEIFTNYNGLRRKSLINTDYNNYHSISNHNNDNKNNVLHDVEMINEHHNNEWNYNNDDKVFDISTSEPLPSVTMPTPTTTMSLIPSKGKTFHKMKDDGRHICVQHKTVQIPVKTREIYSRPTWKHVTEPCEENQICTRVQLVHEPVYRDIVRHKSTRQVTYECCPGWEPTTKNANSCMKPVCKVKCKNGGTCITPDTCSCPKGFTGKYCEEDINECITEKPCDQLCFNTNGSYYCECKKGFILMNDKQSCKKINGFNNDDDAFEARDLENDIDTDTTVLNTRIQKLEKMIANDRITTNELYKNFQTATHLIDSLKTRLTTLEKQQHDISHLQDKLMTNDVKTKTLEYLVNILLKCQKNPHNCQHI